MLCNSTAAVYYKKINQKHTDRKIVLLIILIIVNNQLKVNLNNYIKHFFKYIFFKVMFKGVQLFDEK